MTQQKMTEAERRAAVDEYMGNFFSRYKAADIMRKLAEAATSERYPEDVLLTDVGRAAIRLLSNCCEHTTVQDAARKFLEGFDSALEKGFFQNEDVLRARETLEAVSQWGRSGHFPDGVSGFDLGESIGVAIRSHVLTRPEVRALIALGINQQLTCYRDT